MLSDHRLNNIAVRARRRKASGELLPSYGTEVRDRDTLGEWETIPVQAGSDAQSSQTGGKFGIILGRGQMSYVHSSICAIYIT